MTNTRYYTAHNLMLYRVFIDVKPPLVQVFYRTSRTWHMSEDYKTEKEVIDSGAKLVTSTLDVIDIINA